MLFQHKQDYGKLELKYTRLPAFYGRYNTLTHRSQSYIERIIRVGRGIECKKFSSPIIIRRVQLKKYQLFEHLNNRRSFPFIDLFLK